MINVVPVELLDAKSILVGGLVSINDANPIPKATDSNVSEHSSMSQWFDRVIA